MTENEIEKLIKENKYLKKENEAYKRVTSSRRFLLAEKVATIYNQILPKWSGRRKIFEGSVRAVRKPLALVSTKRKESINRKIARMASSFDKIMVIDSIPWDDKLKQRPHHLANEFAKSGFFVIYFEGANYLQKFRKINDRIVTINSHVFLKGILKEKQKGYFLLPNTMAVPVDVVKQVKEYGFEIIYEYIDEFHGDISGDLSVQLAVWNELPTIRPTLAVASASVLKEDIESHLGKEQKVILAPNAVFTEHFDYIINKDLQVPSDLAPILEKKHPIVGFYGALAPWIDFDLINDLSKKHPEWEFVFLGIDYNNAAKELVHRDNVHILGTKKYEELVYYALNFDVAIIPFKHGQIAKATSPIKLFEYMAAGLPTVCTRDLRECEGYDYVYMAKDGVEFENDILKAMKDRKSETARKRLLEQAKMNTWGKRARDIISALD